MLITPKCLGDIINCSQLGLFTSLYSRNEQGLAGRLPEPLEPWGTARSWAQFGKLLARPGVCLSFLKEDPLQAFQKEMSRKPQEWGEGVRVWLWVLKAIPGCVRQAALPPTTQAAVMRGLRRGLYLNLAPLQSLGQCGQLAFLRLCKIQMPGPSFKG